MGMDLWIGQGDVGKGCCVDLDEWFDQFGVVQLVGVFVDVYQCFVVIYVLFEDQFVLQFDEIYCQF